MAKFNMKEKLKEATNRVEDVIEDGQIGHCKCTTNLFKLTSVPSKPFNQDPSTINIHIETPILL